MCGIAGLFQPRRQPFSPESLRRLSERMANVIRHRGPDGFGTWVDDRGRCGLSHRRLSIIDISDAAAQPFHSSDRRWWLSFNGEIYNFQEIRAKLERQGCRFRSRSDTEVLIEAVAAWGPNVIREFDGMFAFAAFDTATGKLILARDAFGEKPLYYTWLNNGVLAFASELRSLEILDQFDRTINIDAIAEYLSFQYIGAPRSLYARTMKLQPGTFLTLGPYGTTETKRYFEFQPATEEFDNRPLSMLADELEDILVRSLRRRLISDVPLGAFLSGGVDSSTVCALAAKKLGVPLKTYSIGFEAAFSDSEHEVARAFAKHLGTDHHEKIVSPDVGTFLKDFGRTLDEPNADTSCLPTYCLSDFARQHVTVAISGDGGDELFGGYGRYRHILKHRAKWKAPKSLGDGFWEPGNQYYGPSILISDVDVVEGLLGFVPEGFARHLAVLRGEINDACGNILAAMRATDVNHYMPGAVLPKVDRMSMQHSLEVRTPFLNVELARFAERLPESVLADKYFSKKVLREVAYRYLPRDLIDMPKRGFGLPMNDWMRGSLLPIAEKLVGSRCVLRDKLGAKGLLPFLERHRNPATFSAYQLWGFVTLEIWLRDRTVVIPEIPRDVRLTVRGMTLPQPEIWAVPAGGCAYRAVSGTILQPDEVNDDLPACARDALRRYAEMPGAQDAEPILLTGCSGRLYREPDKRPKGSAAILVPTQRMARRLAEAGVLPLVQDGFAKLIVPDALNPREYHEIELASSKESTRLFLRRLREDAGVFVRRLRDKVLRRKKKKKNKRKPFSSPLSFPHVDPMSPEIWFSRFASRYIMPPRSVEPLCPGDRVVVFTHGLVPGGAERQWVYLAKGLKELGYDVTFVTSGRLKGHNEHYFALLKSCGVEIISASGQPLDVLSYSFSKQFPSNFFSEANIAEIAAVFRAINPKVVFAQLDSTNIYAGLAAFIADVPGVVMSFRNYNPTHFPQWSSSWPWMYLGYRTLLKSPRIALTGNFRAANDDYAQWLDADAGKITVIPNAIDETLFPVATSKQASELRRELDIPEDANVVLGVFRLDKEKCPGDFITVCARIAEHDQRARFLIAGIGPLEKDLRLQAAASGIEERVQFLGARSDVNVLMKAANLLLHTAQKEGMPNVILEAMLSETPIVATSAGAIPDLLVHGKTGHIKTPGDIPGLAASCIELLQNQKATKKLGTNAAADVLHHSRARDLAAGYASVAATFFEKSALAAAVKEFEENVVERGQCELAQL